MVLLGPPGERVLAIAAETKTLASKTIRTESVSLDVRGHCCEVFAGTFREVLPSGLAAHSERIADLIPARPGVAGGCDLFVAHVVELGLRTCEFAEGVERVGRKGVGVTKLIQSGNPDVLPEARRPTGGKWFTAAEER